RPSSSAEPSIGDERGSHVLNARHVSDQTVESGAYVLESSSSSTYPGKSARRKNERSATGRRGSADSKLTIRGFRSVTRCPKRSSSHPCARTMLRAQSTSRP